MANFYYFLTTAIYANTGICPMSFHINRDELFYTKVNFEIGFSMLQSGMVLEIV